MTWIADGETGLSVRTKLNTIPNDGTSCLLTIASGKTLTVNNILTFAGTDSTTMTFPTTSATLARTDAANTFTGHQTIEGVTSTGATGTGALVFANTPTLVTPVLGVATATSINKVAITAPASGATLTIADGKTLTVSNIMTLTSTDSSTIAFGGGGTVPYTSNNLSVFAATTSLQLKGVISDETGSGSLVFANTPTLVTPILGVAAGTSLVLNLNGTAAPSAISGTGLLVSPADATTGRVQINGYGAIAAASLARYNGTLASPTGVVNNDQIGGFNAYAYDGSALQGPIASMRVYARATISGSSYASKVGLATCAAGSTTLVDNLIVDSDGHITLEGVTSTGATGTAKFVFSTSPTLITPILGVAAGTSLALGGATIGTDAFGVTGTTTLGGMLTASGAGATSLPAVTFTGALFTGGTGTTTKPLFLIEPTGATAGTGYSTNGTFIGVNSATGFSGNFIACYLNNSSVRFNVTSGGGVTAVGTITGNAFATAGAITIQNATAIPAGGTAGLGYKLSSTSNFGVFFGSGAPSLAAAKGSLYLRSDGTGATDRAYINTDGSTTWTALTTVG